MDRKRSRRSVGVCAVCGETVTVEAAEPGASAQRTAAQNAWDVHVASHSEAELLHFKIRRAAAETPSAERTQHVNAALNALRNALGEGERRGVFSIDEALGSHALYSRWLEAARCSYARCRHAAD